MENGNITTRTLVIALIVALVVAGGIYLFATGSLPRQAEEGQEQEASVPQKLRSLAGRVTEVNLADNSFVILQAAEERSFTVMLGEETEFIRLGFPFDITNPPPDTSFTPTKEAVVMEDLQIGDQVFVRTSVPVSTGDDVINPLEVQILP